MVDTITAPARGRAPTLEWLRLIRLDHHELAHDIAAGLVNGSRYYCIEAYENVLAGAAERFPWMRITLLHPWPWVPVGTLGEPRSDITCLAYRCLPEDAVAAGILTSAMLPQGRKRTAWTFDSELGDNVHVQKCGFRFDEIEVDAGKIRDDAPNSHPLSMFRPSVIRSAGSAAQPRVTAASVARGLRLIVDNTHLVQQ